MQRTSLLLLMASLGCGGSTSGAPREERTEVARECPPALTEARVSRATSTATRGHPHSHGVTYLWVSELSVGSDGEARLVVHESSSGEVPSGPCDLVDGRIYCSGQAVEGSRQVCFAGRWNAPSGRLELRTPDGLGLVLQCAPGAELVCHVGSEDVGLGELLVGAEMRFVDEREDGR